MFSTLLITVSQPFWLNSLAFGKFVTVAQTPSERKAETEQLVKQGVELARDNQFEAALQSFQAALAIYRETDNQIQVASTLNHLGIAYFAQGKYQKAKEAHQEALFLARKIKSQEQEVKSLNGLGNALLFLNEKENVIKLHTDALNIARKIGLQEEVVKALNGLGNAYLDSKPNQKVINYYQQSLSIAQKIGYKEGEGKALTNLGNAYQSLKEYEKAIVFYEQALSIVKSRKDIRIQAITLWNLGNIYTFVGQYQNSIKSNEEALAIYKKLGNKNGEMSTYVSLGVAYRNLEKYEKAIEYNNQSLALAQELNDKKTQAMSYGNLGVANFFLGRYQKAIEFQEQALALYRDIKLKEGEGLTLGNLGLAYDSLGEHRKAITFYQQSLAFARELDDRLREGNALNNIGTSYMNLKQYADASNQLLEAINVYENYLRAGLNDSNKVSIFDTYSRSYRLLQQAYIAQNKTLEALEIAEQSKARAFVELLNSKLSNNYTTQNSQAIKFSKVEDIRRIAKEQNAVIVQYSINDSRQYIYMWVIKPTGEISFHFTDLQLLLQQKTSLKDLVSSTRDSIGVDDRSIFTAEAQQPVNKQSQTKSLQQLHQLLISPIANLLPTDPNQRVIFVPQNELFLVPFPALQDAQGKYLIEKHTILTAPSIQVLESTRQLEEKVKRANVKDAVVVGNPTMPSVVPRVGSKPQQLSDLPGAKTEAESIATILNTKALTGDQATKAAVLSRISQAKTIHFATHGLFDEFQGLQSSIALAPTNKDNGLLTAEEILNLNLNADLVVLSACNTGRGRITGDGVIGLSRALISAGTPSVIVSLWSVPDSPTSDLMKEFYVNLYQKRLDKAQSLRMAMLKLKDKYPDSPKKWAAFTLIGEAD